MTVDPPGSAASDSAGRYAPEPTGVEPPSRLVATIDWLVRAEGVAALLALSTPTAIALAAAVYSALNQNPQVALTLVVVATQLAGIIIVIVLLRRLADRLAPRSDGDVRAGGAHARGYRMASIDVTYRIDPANPRRHAMTSRETVVSERDGLTHVTSDFFWTGTGRQETPSLTGDPDVKMYFADPDHPLEDFRIFFGGHDGLKAGARRSYELSADLYDEEDTFKPYLRQLIEVPTDHLRLVVALPPDEFPGVFAHVREPNDQASRALDQELTIYPELGVAVLAVTTPVLRAEYSLEWFPPIMHARSTDASDTMQDREPTPEDLQRSERPAS